MSSFSCLAPVSVWPSISAIISKSWAADNSSSASTPPACAVLTTGIPVALPSSLASTTTAVTSASTNSSAASPCGPSSAFGSANLAGRVASTAARRRACSLCTASAILSNKGSGAIAIRSPLCMSTMAEGLVESVGGSLKVAMTMPPTSAAISSFRGSFWISGAVKIVFITNGCSESIMSNRLEALTRSPDLSDSTMREL